MAPRDLVLDTAEAQRMALFFDYILIYDSLARNHFDSTQNRQYTADFDYLREQGVALKCVVDMPFSIDFGTSGGRMFNPIEEMKKDCDLLLPFDIDNDLPTKAENETDADHMVRCLSSRLMYKNSPVVAHVTMDHLCTTKLDLNAVQITLKNVPLPPENIPWDDLIQFRKEEENIAKLRALRLWLQQRAVSNQPPEIVQEELEHLLYEYQKYMNIQHKKFGLGFVSALISSTPEIIANICGLNFGAAMKPLFDIKGRHIALEEGEFSAPGREVSYITKVNEFSSTYKT